MGGGGPKVPTLGEIAQVAVDTAASVVSGGYTMTEPGKKDKDKIQAGVTGMQESLTGHTGRVAADTAKAEAEAQQRARDAKEAEMERKRKKQGEFATARGRQQSLMASQGGRAGTILTAGLGEGGGLGGSGKTLLGS